MLKGGEVSQFLPRLKSWVSLRPFYKIVLGVLLMKNKEFRFSVLYMLESFCIMVIYLLTVIALLLLKNIGCSTLFIMGAILLMTGLNFYQCRKHTKKYEELKNEFA